MTVVALALLALSARAQQDPQQRPVFKAGATFVNVDAYPRRDGKVVENLTKADFEILEDGKPQSVENFEFVRVAPNTPDAERRDPSSAAESNRQAADPHNRVFVVFLDLFHTQIAGSYYARQPVINFLTRTIGPTDLFGVMTPEMPVNGLTFGRRTETIEAELSRHWDWGESGRLGVFARNPTEERLMLCPAGEGLVLAYREDLTASSLEALMMRLGNLRDERKNILFISEGWVPRQAAPMGSGGGDRARLPGIGVGPTGQLGVGTNASGYSDLAWCDGQALRFANIDYDSRFRNLLTMARQSNVAFYPVDVAGLRTMQLPASQPGGVAAQEAYRASQVRKLDVLQELAINTDGRAVVNTNDLSEGVRAISDDLSAYYLLGYYTNNTAADGKYRRIEVKVKQPGVKVSARRGYFAPTEEMRKAEAAAAARPVRDTTAVDVELERLGKLSGDARVFTSAILSATSLDVVVEMSAQELSSGNWKDGAAFKIEVTSRDEGGKPIAAEGRIEPGLRSGMVKIPLAGSSAAGWRLRVRVQSATGLLEDDIVVSPSKPSLIGDAIAYRAAPGPRAPIRAVADYKFYRTERIHVEWPVTKSLDERSARLLNRRGEPLAVPVTVTERVDGDRIVVAADLVLGPLADADYVIELTGAAGGEKLQKLLAFRVVR